MKLNFWLGCVSAFVLASSAFAELDFTSAEKGDLTDSSKVVTTVNAGTIIKTADELSARGWANLDAVVDNVKGTIVCYWDMDEDYWGDADEDWEDGDYNNLEYADVGYLDSEWVRDPIGYDSNLEARRVIWLWRGKDHAFNTGVYFYRYKTSGVTFWYVNSGARHSTGSPSWGNSDKVGEGIRYRKNDDTFISLLELRKSPHLRELLSHYVRKEELKDAVEDLGLSAGSGGVDEEAVNALIEAKLETKLAPEAFKQVAGAAMNTIYDEALGVTWKATMINGSLYYTAIVNEDATAIK